MTTFTEKVEELLVNSLNDVVGDYAQKVAGERVSINIDNPEVKQALTNMLAPTQQALLAAHHAEISRALERVNKEVIGDDEEVPINDVGGRVPARVLRNDLRETQRQAINKIKGEYTPTKENLSQEEEKE